MADSRPVSLRLSPAEFEQLEARAYALSAKPSGVARDLIRIGLAGGDNKALSDRLMAVERRLAALDHQARDIHADARAAHEGSRRLLTMFDALLATLSGGGVGRAA